MDVFDLMTAGVLGVLAGFWSGRSLRWKMEESEERAEQTAAEEHLVPEGAAIGSPVSGEVCRDAEETAGRISIVPEEGKVFAPAAGKVLRLYPMGNRIRFLTESGTELLLNICRDREELHSACYRCNVLQNEIVRKGKLLLEFDRETLAGEGVDTAVTVEVCPAAETEQIVRTWKEHIRAGEELLWVRRRNGETSYEKSTIN